MCQVLEEGSSGRVKGGDAHTLQVQNHGSGNDLLACKITTCRHELLVESFPRKGVVRDKTLFAGYFKHLFAVELA